MLWATIVMLFLFNSFRTQGVDPRLLASSSVVEVTDHPDFLSFTPKETTSQTALLFFPGSGVATAAYAPLLHPIAEAGYPVFIVKLPWQFAPFSSHKQLALDRARTIIETHPDITHWTAAGHSLGGALTSQLAHTDSQRLTSIVLIGTTHPKQLNLSSLTIPVSKVYATNDGVAPAERVKANAHLLPPTTEWIEITGGNHSQFGHYGHQLFDGSPTLSREYQQSLTRDVLLKRLQVASPP